MQSTVRSLIPAPDALRRGALLGVVLWLVFLVLTAYTSAVTLFDRIQSTDVMKAASGSVWQGRVSLEIAAFLLAQTGLHIAAAMLTWMLAVATAVLSATARKKFGRMVTAWFCALAGAVLVYNALWYPRTLIGAYYHDSVATMLGPWPVGQWIYSTVMVVGAATLVGACTVTYRGSRSRSSRRNLAFGALVLLSLGLAMLWPTYRSAIARVDAHESQPNVIVIGIDSLRLEQLRRFGGSGLTPNLDNFLADADTFVDATTPAARTFSSWSAILTGRAPTVTGARFNLAARSTLQVDPTVAELVREAGYRTIYSTDEVRFANIDESFGFDEIVTPRIGASDFIIGTYNEVPLASVVINLRVGKWLFPFSHGNRGVATMFQPQTYLERLDREVSFERPTLFIAHLTAAHWPYYTADTPFGISKTAVDVPHDLYMTGLQTADRMFGELMGMLQRKGALDHATVIVLSDHGEAMGLPSDTFFDSAFFVKGLRSPLRMLSYGHGQSVLSKSQYQVLLAFKSFGAGFESSGRNFRTPVTVEDIAPTILESIGGDPGALKPTGTSLWSVLESGLESHAARDRVRFTETDLAVLPAPGGGIDEEGTARQNSMFFEIDAASGRLQINPEYAPLALAYKERAAFMRDKLLAAIPAGPYAHQFLYFDFGAHAGELLLDRPGEDRPDAQKLWDALHEHYAGELRAPVAITRDDWDRITAEWNAFLVDRRDLAGSAGT